MFSHQNWFLQSYFANILIYLAWMQSKFHVAVSFIGFLWRENEQKKVGDSHEFKEGRNGKESKNYWNEGFIPLVDYWQRGKKLLW